MKYIYRNENCPVEVEADSRMKAVSEVYHILREISDRPEYVDYEDIIDNTQMMLVGDCAYDEVIDNTDNTYE